MGCRMGIRERYVCMYVRTYVCMYDCMYVCMRARTHTRTHACTHARTYVCMYVCTYVRTYVRMYVCMCVRTKVALLAACGGGLAGATRCLHALLYVLATFYRFSCKCCLNDFVDKTALYA